MKKPVTKKKKLDIFVKVVFFYFIGFVIIAWVTFWVKDSVPDTLIQFGLGGGAIELACMAAIEIFTNKKVEKKDDEMVD
jgi:mannose/fructose/N-acetylgalactosamine-specific phosphotransferase system component IIC